MTTPRSVFLVQMLDKLGAPLLGAVSDVAARKNAAGAAALDAPLEAVTVAELLGKSVQVSVALAERMELRDSGGDADAVRLALAGLAAGLIGNHYRRADKAPDDAEIKKLVNALEAVLAFADNFTPAAENTARLQALVPGLYPADESQVAIQYVHALASVANEITGFAFGQPEKKLAQEVAGRLVGTASSLRRRLVPASGPGEERQAELGLLRALSSLYVDCHRAEKTRLAALSAEERAKAALPGGALSMDRLWQDFDTRISMLETLVESALAGGGASAAAVIAPSLPSKPVAPPVISAPVSAPTAATAAPAASPPAEDGGSGAPYNPMSFFKPGPKKEEGKEGSA